AAFKVHMQAPPLTQAQACADGLSDSQIIAPPAAEGATLRVFGHQADGTAGWKHYQAAKICGAPMLVESGFDELAIGGPGAATPEVVSTRAPDRFIVTPWPDRPPWACPRSTRATFSRRWKECRIISCARLRRLISAMRSRGSGWRLRLR
ncbi:MAG: hypothetical protein ABMA14_26125, partial [Hyphomonadaceae bacterium]